MEGAARGTKIDIGEYYQNKLNPIALDDVFLIHAAQRRFYWRNILNTLVNFRTS
jgi:hypothetical protein